MNVPSGTLIALLRLLGNEMPGDEAARVRARIEQHPEWQECWLRLQQASGELVSVVEEPVLSAERIAAFLDGSLSSAEAAETEASCWRSAADLRELVSSYRFSREPLVQGESMSAEFEARLNGLRPKLSLPERGGSDGSVVRPPPLPSLDLKVNGSHAKATRTVASRRWALALSIAASLLVILIGTFAWRNLSPREDVIKVVEDRSVESPGQAPIESVVVEDTNPQPDPELPQEGIVDDSTRDPITHGSDQLPSTDVPDPLVDHPAPDEAAPTLVGPTETPMTTEMPPTASAVVPESISVQWTEIEGLLAAKDQAAETWRGAEASSGHDPPTEFSTLPESWASAQFPLGELVMNAETHVTLAREDKVLVVDVDRGEVAVRELAAGTGLGFKTPAGKWDVEVIQDGTAVGLTLVDRQPQFHVRRGAVMIDGIRLRQGRRLAWNGSEFVGPEPGISTRWFDRPTQRSGLSQELQTELLRSRDLRVQLLRMSHSGPSDQQGVLARWSLAMFPHDAMTAAMSNWDRQRRLVMIHWVTTLDPTDPRARTAWRLLAERTDDAAMVRQLVAWGQQSRRGTRVTREEAARMLRGLQHASPVIRHFAAYYLELAFGRRVDYDPDGSDAERRRAIQAWTAYLRTVFRADLRPNASTLQ